MRSIYVASLLAMVFSTSVAAGPVVVDDFNSYTNGPIVGQAGWQSYGSGSNFIIQGDVVFEGTKALHNTSYGDATIGKPGLNLLEGRQTFYFRTENRDSWGFYGLDGNAGMSVGKGLNHSGGRGPTVTLKQDGHVAYYDPGADVYQNFATYEDNVWTALEMEWASNGTARYRVNSMSWTSWYPTKNSGPFDYVNLNFVLTSGSGGIYFDSLAAYPVPEPPTKALAGIACLLLILWVTTKSPLLREKN